MHTYNIEKLKIKFTGSKHSISSFFYELLGKQASRSPNVKRSLPFMEICNEI